MTREEAAKTLTELWGVDYRYCLGTIGVEAVDMAIEALKQPEIKEDVVPAKKIVTAKDRVEEERMQLAERLDKLTSFLGSEECSEISRKQYDLLLMQRNVMTRYLIILDSRLVSWGEK